MLKTMERAAGGSDRKGKRPAHVGGSATSAGTASPPAPKPRKMSRFKGVCWDVCAGKWHVRISNEGKVTSLGRFADEEEAGRAYEEAARRLKGGGGAPQQPPLRKPKPSKPKLNAGLGPQTGTVAAWIAVHWLTPSISLRVPISPSTVSPAMQRWPSRTLESVPTGR